MRFVQFYLDCLSQASYLIGDEDTGRAVVVDPRRDVDIYLDDAAGAGLTIELIIETHFHADFVSGHLELAAATGAEIAYGSSAAGSSSRSSRRAHESPRRSGDRARPEWAVLASDDADPPVPDRGAGPPLRPGRR